jgi:hypothetical protein
VTALLLPAERLIEPHKYFLAQIPIPSALSALTDFYFKPLSQFVVDPYRQIPRH